MKGEEVNRADLAASFQKAVVDVLVEHTMQAARDYHMDKSSITVVLSLSQSEIRHCIQIPAMTGALFVFIICCRTDHRRIVCTENW